jgi:prophage tail gpP-like protein
VTGDANLVKLLVDGQAFGGWKDVAIRQSLECMAGAFHLSVTRKWDGQQEPYKLREGLPCQVLIGDDVVITGYIDEYSPEGDKDSASITVQGRDKTADLVDCSAIHKSGQWLQSGLQRIVTDLAKPFGIGVTLDAGVSLGEAFKSFALQEGEKVFEAIDRACRMRAVLCTSSPTGEVLLTRSGSQSTGVQLIEGVNIETYSARHTWAERFSVVTVKGQGPGDDDEWGAAVAHGKAEAKDAEIDRYRPLIVLAEHGAGLKALKDRATWETQVRMGRGKRGEVTVTGWRTGRDGAIGELWRPNRLVHITSPAMNLDDELLIVGCSYELSNNKGAQTRLTFARREAFEVVDGVRRSRLNGRLNHRSQREKHKKGDGYQPSWDLSAPKKETR